MSLEEQALQRAKSFRRRPNKVVEWFKRHKKNAIVLTISTALVAGSVVYAMTKSRKETKKVIESVYRHPPRPDEDKDKDKDKDKDNTTNNSKKKDDDELTSTVVNNWRTFLTSTLPVFGKNLFSSRKLDRLRTVVTRSSTFVSDVVLKALTATGDRLTPSYKVFKTFSERLVTSALEGTLNVNKARQNIERMTTKYTDSSSKKKLALMLQIVDKYNAPSPRV